MEARAKRILGEAALVNLYGHYDALRSHLLAGDYHQAARLCDMVHSDYKPVARHPGADDTSLVLVRRHIRALKDQLLELAESKNN